VRDYSRLGDPVFNDWDNIQLDFSNYADFLGNSFERSRSGVSLEPENPELDLTEIEESIGPLDREVPTVTISAPAPNTSIPLGTPLVVRFVATDDIGIDVNAVGVSFDLDGDGTFDDPGETIPAVQTGPNSFEAVFARVSGPVGTRLVLASVKDLAGRAEGASVAVVVSSGLASNTPPTANAGPDQTVVAGVGCLVTVSLDGRDSSDPDGDALTFTWTGPFGTASGPTPTVSLPLGTHTITLTVDDGKGGTASDQVVVTVQDTTAPVPDLASLPTVTGECSAQITSPPTATDSCAGKITGTTSDPLSYSQQGTFTVTWTFSDGKGNAATQIQIVIVKDVTPPNIQSVTATPNSLWPPNHKMVPVTVAVSTLDNCSGAPVCRISSVSSNEPVNGTGDGDTAPDWEITGNLTVNLRAERSGSGNGRVYTITVACTDASGNSSTKTTTVTVPHDQGKK